MTVDELSAMIEECAGESVLHEAYAVDPEQTRTTLEKLVDDWNAGKDFDPAVYDLLMGRVVERDGDSTMQTGWLKQPYPIFKLLSSVSGSPDCNAVRSWCSTKHWPTSATVYVFLKRGSG